MVCPIGGLPKCPKFGCSGDTFGGCWLLLILTLQKYVDHTLLNISMVCPIGGLPKYPKFGCSGDTFGGCWSPSPRRLLPSPSFFEPKCILPKCN